MAKKTTRARKTASRRSSSTAARSAASELERILLKREVWGLALIAAGTITVIALLVEEQGRLTAVWSEFLRSAFGIGALPVGAIILGAGVLLFLWAPLKEHLSITWDAIVGAELVFFFGLGLAHGMRGTGNTPGQVGDPGGIIGWALWSLLEPLLGAPLATITILVGLLLGVYLLSGKSWRVILWRVAWIAASAGVSIRQGVEKSRLARKPDVAPVPAALPPAIKSDDVLPASPKPKRKRKPRPAPAMRSTKPAPERTARRARSRTKLPTLDLLVADEADDGDDADARQRSQIIEETLDAFGIPARVLEWHRGPVVTQFGVEPGYIEKTDREGNPRRTKIRVSKILSLTNDLALALAAAPIRIEAPIPGRAMVGIEVPNSEKSVVGLRGVLESSQYRKMRSKLRLALGRDVSGQAVIGNLSSMPHLLLAGATGSGKSVCLNAIIASLLYQNTPDELKLVLVDPKRVEMTKYDGIPHLIAPVIVDVERVIAALRWLTREMQERYKSLARVKARDIRSYNRAAKSRGLEPMPTIVVVIDELADLMLAAPDDVERTICRLAQMARATGIHLVLATQRPSVDVVTGLIKANFPSRVSFAVSSQVDSRVILDSPGAERLLGRGDMLYMASDSPKLQRIQGCFVSDQELDALTDFWRRTTETEDEPTDDQSVPWDDLDGGPVDADDDLIRRAIDLVKQHRHASASFLQRHLRVGYPRAARLIDQLEEMGIVGPLETGGRSREVLLRDESDPVGEPESQFADTEDAVVQDETVEEED